MPKQHKQQSVNRVGPMSAVEAARRLTLADMSSEQVTRALAAADSSLEPVTQGLSPRVADVYASRIFGGYTIAWRRGPIPS